MELAASQGANTPSLQRIDMTFSDSWLDNSPAGTQARAYLVLELYMAHYSAEVGAAHARDCGVHIAILF